MKLRSPWLIRVVAWMAAHVVRLWMRTVRIEFWNFRPDLDPRRPESRQRYIYVFWHENMLLPLSQYGGCNVAVLISQHADGQLIAEACDLLGFHAVRGSSRRGGADAVRQMLHTERADHLAITPDGPRGPRRMVQPGVIYLAARTGLPIVPVGFGYERPWRVRSWDRFAVPRPFRRGRSIFAEPIVVPPDAERDTLEYYRRVVENALESATNMAERWAETGNLPMHRVQDGEVEPNSTPIPQAVRREP